MKDFSTLIVAKAPPERLFATIRDRLPELAGDLDDIDAVEELERTPAPDGVLVVSRWHARAAIPALLRSRLGQGSVSWVDRARWDATLQVCSWTIEPSIGDGAITCAGETRFIPAMGGRGSRVEFGGRLDVAPNFLASIVGGLQAPAKLLIESIATSLIPANFRGVAEAAAKVA